ncbi:MAG: sugar phosphate isomerase/epimerase [Fuerstiella sp.]|nr:sugar phosphate isomerase/epimerase [Fuerstiella sp.]
MPHVSYSTAGFGGTELGPALDQIGSVGFRTVEIDCDRHVPGKHSSAVALDVRRQLDERGMAAATVHAPARRVVLGAPEEEWRKENIPVFEDALRLTGEIGAHGLVIHGIPNPIFLDGNCELKSMYETMVASMRRSVEDLMPTAEAAGVRMLLENLPYNRDLLVAGKDGDYPLMRMTDLRAFADDFPPAQLGLIVDVGHAWTDGLDPAQEIQIAGERLWGTHLQDVDRENPQDNHWAPLVGGLDWSSIISALQHVSYTGAWTFEVIMPRRGESPLELAEMTIAAARAWGIVNGELPIDDC